ncbi:dynein light chain [Paecilomyces variotii No. 5]|uniref:Dynein light chain n=1 Tax=Byssochlamys spectabilis (strain No. 5 / NBRC 109023) TaxID=1356009 RepID=V5FG84_BYSSN|nr:dynein light chain [Paecilomyces variotii No. 5]
MRFIQPVPTTELTKLATEACDNALKSVEGYDHAKVGSWNSEIINHILQSLIKATTPSTPNTPPPFRFTVNSTIVQQGLVDKSTTSGDAGKRGMHSASGAFWDVNRDGMWTFKYPGGEQRGLDVVVSVTWFAMA